MNMNTTGERQALTAAALLRPQTNLVPHAEYALSKEELASGFMGVFNWAYTGDARKTMLKLVFAPLMDMTALSLGKPPRAANAEERKDRKLKNQKISKFETGREEFNLAQYTTLKKVNDGPNSHFLLGLPIIKFSSPDSVNAILSLFDGPSLTDDGRKALEIAMAQAEPTSRVSWPSKDVIPKAGLHDKAAKIFSEALVEVRYKSVPGGTTIGFLVFKIDMKAAQYLVSTDWVEIRPVDLYPLFIGWVEAEYQSRLYGKSAMSLSKIADTLPRHLEGDERVDEYSIGILVSGEPIWIPRVCNNTQRYESMYSSAGSKENGEFALRQLGNSDTPKLPVNIPILVDWVNNKFTYSNSMGKPVILDLAHLRKCTASMALNIMRRDMHNDYVETLVFYARECRVSDRAKDYGGDLSKMEGLGRLGLKDGMTIAEYAAFAIKRWFELTKSDTVRYYDIMDAPLAINEGRHHENDTTSGSGMAVDDPEMLLAPIARFIRALAPAMLANSEALFVKYAVKTIIENLGLLNLLVSYGSDLVHTTTVANTINKAPLSQGVDPNWTPPACPLLTDKFSQENSGLLPHQSKIRNIMRDRPDLAAWPVDAGGGKSMLAITDILYEIKHSESAPYLVMCPSHLVANYVSEIVEFTDGKINVIPVTTYNIQTTGIKRFMEILETAPINTILVVDYDCLKYMGRATVYGTSTIYVYPVVEMIRRFKPGYVLMDESHFLRNTGNARMKAVMTLVADIKKKRVASGTMNPDSPSDFPGQMAILDPTIFGTRSQFNEKYGEQVSGQRVLLWKTKGKNSIASVLPTLQENVVWAPAKRKEWACALPPRRDRFIPVELSENQMKVYDAIFDDMIQQIKKKAETSKQAAKLLEKLQGKKASTEDEEQFGDLVDQEKDDEEDEDEEDVGPALQPYLADIERFVSNPAGHPYAKNGFISANGERHPPLTGADLVSPKARELAKQLKAYLDSHESKALIFTNYNETTDTLFAAMPKELQDCGLLYKTGNKTEFVNRFKTDKKIRWMIGIRKSLEVGLNLQQAGYLVRMEGVWNPGEQEQGDSRIERPNFSKSGDQRTELLFDTIVANHTIDITKAARLRAKIVANAKFDNTRNPAYSDENIPPIKVIPMNIETIRTMNDFDSNLAAYQDSMRALNTVIKEEYAEYRERIMAEGGFKFTQVAQAPIPPGAAILARVPYAQGTELYKSSEMGLIRVDNYLGLELTPEDEEDDDEGGDEIEKDSDVIREQRQKVLGKPCHCEFGDGRISGAAAIGKNGNFITRINVALNDGTAAVKLKATNVFIMTRTETNSIDMRNKLAQAAGMKVTAPITVPGTVIRTRRITRQEQEEQERAKKKTEVTKKSLFVQKKSKLAVNIKLTMLNGYMRLSYTTDENQTAAHALEAIGFKKDAPYYAARIKNAQHLAKQAKLWADAGFDTTNKVDNDTFDLLHDELMGGNLASGRRYNRLISSGQFRNYLREEFKPSADKKLLNLFCLVTDEGAKDSGAVKDAQKAGTDPTYGIAFLCLPYGGGHPASKLAINNKYRAPQTHWEIVDNEYSVFVNNLAGAKKVIQNILDAGMVVENMDELKEDARHVKKAAYWQDPKDDQHVSERGPAAVEEEEEEPAAKPKKVVKPVKKTR